MDEHHRTFDHGDSSIAFLDEGAGSDVLVMVAGLPGSTRDFRWLAPALAADVRVIRVDLPGYGESPRPRFTGLSTADFADCVGDLIAQLELPGVVLVGHSSGSAVVAHLAARLPEQVRGCALLAPPGVTPHFPTWAYGLGARALHVPGARILLDPVARLAFRMARFPSYLTGDERAHTVLDDAAFDFASHARNLSAIIQPTLVAWARDDRVIPVERFHEVAGIVPDGPRIEFADGGHALQKVHARELADALLAFTRSLRA